MNMLILRKSLNIINSLWLRAGAIYFADHVTLLGSIGLTNLFGTSSHAAWIKLVDKGILLSLKAIFITWTLGRILEIISCESPAAHFHNFKYIVRRGTWVIIMVMTVPWAIHFLPWTLNNANAIPIDIVTAFLTPGLAFWAAHQLIKIKYGHIPSETIKDIPVSWPILLTGLILLALSLMTYILSQKLLPTAWAAPMGSILSTQIFFLSFTLFAHKVMDTYPQIKGSFASERTLILINPPAGNTFLAVFAIILRNYPPFFCVLKALTPERYRIIEYNRFLWQDRYYQDNALVAISCFTSNSAEAYKIARGFRKRGAKVIIGGPHVTFFPDEALEFCDSVVMGPAESIWDTVIQDYENNSLKPVYHGNYCQQAQDRTYQYLLKAPINITASFLQSSRGCKFNCYFCAIHAITGHHLPERTLEEIVTLVKRVAAKKQAVSFIDNNIYLNPAYAREFLRALIPLKVRWGADASIDIAKDEEAMRLLKESGCHTLLIGYEITAVSGEKGRGGKFAYVDEYIALTRKIQKLGIKIKAHFIFGFPGDDWKTLAKIWWFCFRLSPTSTALSFLTPLPGSKFLDDTIREERLINLNWRDYDIYQQVSAHPKLGKSYFLQKAFLLMVMFFFMTTSSLGRIFLVIFIILEFIFYHGV